MIITAAFDPLCISAKLLCDPAALSAPCPSLDLEYDICSWLGNSFASCCLRTYTGQSQESCCPNMRTLKMLLLVLAAVLAGLSTEASAKPKASSKEHQPYWPSFSAALRLDAPAAEDKAPDPEILKVVPHETHHQHDTEFWTHYLETHEQKDRNHSHDDDRHFQESSFGYETEHHCIYDLRLNYVWGSPDGVWKRMIVYNGQFPGPTLYCTAGKKMVVRVTNDIEDDSEPTSIHWHGIQQTLTPFYDGPQALAQCPLLHRKTMIYKFPVFQAGTYWYHSHHSYQYIDGNWGFLVIKNRPGEVWGKAYDEERLIAVNDWYHRTARELVDKYVEKGVDGGGWPSVNSSLINGRGSFNCSLKEPGQICNPKLQGPAIVNVKQGKRYRFRILNSSAQNAYNFSIDAHKMQVIETDGVDTQKSPKFDVLYIIPGQRYSVIVIMDQPPGEYWIRSVSDPPEIAGPPGAAILSVAPNENGFKDLLKRGAEPREPDFSVGQGRAHYHNVPWEDIINAGGIPIPQSNQFDKYFPSKLIDVDLQLQQKLDAQHLKQLQAIKLPTTIPVDPRTALLVDDLSDTPPLLFGPDGGRAPLNYSRQVTFDVADCPTAENKARLCMNGWSWTPLSLNAVPVLHQAIKGQEIAEDQIPVYTPIYQEAVRIVINNAHPFSHPWHLHGHTFWLLGAGAENAGRFNASRDEQLLRTDGVRRDTIRTKSHSWAVVVYYTDNPGVWFFHCHIAWHLEVGLGATFIEAGDIARRIYHVAPFEAKKTCTENGVKI